MKLLVASRLLFVTCLLSVSGWVSASPIHIQITPGSQAYFVAFTVENSNQEIAGVAVRDNVNYVDWLEGSEDSIFGWMFNTTGNAFQLPLSVRFTSVSGEVLIAHELIHFLTDHTIYATNDNFAINVPTAHNVLLLLSAALMYLSLFRRRALRLRAT